MAFSLQQAVVRDRREDLVRDLDNREVIEQFRSNFSSKNIVINCSIQKIATKYDVGILKN